MKVLGCMEKKKFDMIMLWRPLLSSPIGFSFLKICKMRVLNQVTPHPQVTLNPSLLSASLKPGPQLAVATALLLIYMTHVAASPSFSRLATPPLAPFSPCLDFINLQSPASSHLHHICLLPFCPSMLRQSQRQRAAPSQGCQG